MAEDAVEGPVAHLPARVPQREVTVAFEEEPHAAAVAVGMPLVIVVPRSGRSVEAAQARPSRGRRHSEIPAARVVADHITA